MKRKFKLVAPVATEFHEMRALFEWTRYAEAQYPELRTLNASMNGLRVSDPRIIVQAKLVGLKPGYPDIFLPVPRGALHGLYIELKRTVGGKLSDEQMWWRDVLQHQGYAWSCCKGFNEARKVIVEYLNLPNGESHDAES